jgi:hypothetical protein
VTTLSARYVRQPRRTYWCDWCGRSITGPYIRLYGNGMESDPMHTLRLHPTDRCCPRPRADPKVAAALDQVKGEQ